MQPEISVILMSYNHGRYIAQTIQSVLDQTFKNFEFLISDDASTDNSQETINAFKDDRIITAHCSNNTGGTFINELIKRAKGKYIALINSDDYWTDPQKLAKQLHVLATNQDIGACFTHAILINEEGKSQHKALQKRCVFNKKNMSQAELIRYFFDHENCLCLPSVLIKKDTLMQAGGFFNHNYTQLADYDLWIRLCTLKEIYILEEKLTAFRVSSFSQSHPTLKSLKRLNNERFLISLHFFEHIPKHLFYKAFSDLIKYPSIKADTYFAIEKAFLVFNKKEKHNNIYKLAGTILLNKLMQQQTYKTILEQEYHFSPLRIQKILTDNVFFAKKIVYWIPFVLARLKHSCLANWIKSMLAK